MKSIVIVSVLAAAANANPILFRGLMCNLAPTATPATEPAPLSSPGAAIASACQQQCDVNGSCQSFVFGLPPSAASPKCILFAVPADQVPSQGTNLNVFDKACAASTVPTQAPTAAGPQGPANGNGAGNSAGNNAGTGQGNGRNPAKRANICGAAPSGPSSSAPSPLQTATQVVSQQACLSLCQKTKGCQS